MPELPEVETTRIGISPYISGHSMLAFKAHHTKLRWPIPADKINQLVDIQLLSVQRRAKYLIFDFGQKGVIAHLGMSGSLRVASPVDERRKHDHWEMFFPNNVVLRYHDPRRFGALLFWEGNPLEHSLLASLGPEPLSQEFDGNWLYLRSRDKKQPIKSFLMDSRQLVGVGNIYANEALFLAGIRPDIAAGKVSRPRYQELSQNIKELLCAAIKQGGTTLKDFVSGHGEPGYFQQTLRVYGKEHHPCPACTTPIKHKQIGQRSSWYCPNCQK